jgi:hypothetical protein
MSDTAPRNPVSAPQMLADALLRSVAGTSAQLRLTAASNVSTQSEVGLIATAFTQVAVNPVVMRKLRPTVKAGDAPRWELLVSATSVQTQINTLDIPSAQASNEAFGQTYLYRLALREACPQTL